MKKYLAEMVGTMVLVLMGCGSAVMAGGAAAAIIFIGGSILMGYIDGVKKKGKSCGWG